MSPIRIGTAGWTIPAAVAGQFPPGGSVLERYGRVLNCTEINTSFYRPHKPDTYRRWADSVPDDFRFALKVPKRATHELKLADTEPVLDQFLAESAGLGAKRGPLLVQLPPKQAFEPELVGRFFSALRERCAGPIACEPRHASWATPEAEALLRDLRVGRVVADPQRFGADALPGGSLDLVYLRLHGSPRIYFSAYEAAALQHWQSVLEQHPQAERWCIFDNTASGAALADALALRAQLTA